MNAKFRAHQRVNFNQKYEEVEEIDMATRLDIYFLQNPKKELGLQQHFGRYGNPLPVFGFNVAIYDLKLIKS